MIESEKSINQEGLEEEISKKYANDTTTMRTREQYAELARHFAQWGAEHLADVRKTSTNDLEEASKEYMQGEIDSGHDCLEVETNEPLYYPEAMKHAFIAGAKWQKEQMMKEFETWLKGNLHHLSCWNADEFCTDLKCYLGMKNE